FGHRHIAPVVAGVVARAVRRGLLDGRRGRFPDLLDRNLAGPIAGLVLGYGRSAVLSRSSPLAAVLAAARAPPGLLLRGRRPVLRAGSRRGELLRLGRDLP